MSDNPTPSTDTQTPMVSVVIPTRNGEPYIRQTLEQVLAQTGCSLEVVMVNDGSTDGSEQTAASMNDPRLRIVDGPCQGIAPSVNAGLAAARGKYVVRCDADDLLPPGRLQWQVDWLEAHPEFAAVCAMFHTISDKGKPLAPMRTGATAMEITSELHTGKTRTHFGTFMTRAEVLRKIGGARPYFNGTEDIDLQLRIATDHRVWYEPVHSYDYRLHGTSTTHVQPSLKREFLTETAREFARQRAAGRDDDLALGQPPEVPEDDSKGIDTRDHVTGMLMSEAWQKHKSGQRVPAIASGWRACCHHPASWPTWKSFFMLLVKAPKRQQG